MEKQTVQQNNQFSPALYAAIAVIGAELSKLSNKEAKEALTMLGSVRNLRVVSADRPIGLSTGQVRNRPSIDVRARTSRPQKVAWKSDPRWIREEKLHSDLVDQIKSETNSIEKSALICRLRQQEADMKTLKHQLSGFHEPS
jgi:hypothetical protein